MAVSGGCSSRRRLRTLLLSAPGAGPSRAQHVKKSANRSSAGALGALITATRSSRAPGTAGQAVQVKPRRRILEGGGLRTRVPTCFSSWESIAGRLHLSRSREILLPGTCSLATAPARDSLRVPWCSAHAGLPLATLKKTITPSLGGDVSQTFNSKESTANAGGAG